MAQQTAEIPTTAQLQERLKALAEAPDTKHHNVDKPRKTAMKLNKTNDLVNVSAKGAFGGMVDGGGGTNVLRLDDAAHSTLGKTRNFLAMHVTKGEWEHTGSFTGWGVIEPTTGLINTGHIEGQVGIFGELNNKGTVASNVSVESGARLVNSGTVSSRVDVRENATFRGNGTVDTLDVAGLMEVGPEMGAPSVVNDLKFSKTATLVYGIDAEKGSATIKVGGTATLGNAMLKITSVPGESIGAGKHVVIKAGKVDGKFGPVINELAFMAATPDYTTEAQVELTLTLKEVARPGITPTQNSQQVLDSILKPQHDEPTLPDPALALPTTQISVTESPTSPPPSNSTEPLKVAASAKPKSVVQAQAVKPAQKPNAAINALLGTNLTTAADAIDQLGGYDTADLGNATLSSVTPISTGMLSAMSRRNPADGYDNGQVWVQAIGNSGSLTKQLGSFALKHSTKGLMLGTDWAVSPVWRLGIIGSKTQTRLDSYQFDGALDSWLVGAYALRQDGPLALRLGAVYGSHDGSTKRHVAFNGFRDRLKGRYDATTQQVFGQIGYNLDVGHFDIEPYVQVGYQRYRRDAYTEKGGDAALQYNGQAQEHYSSDLGLRLARPLIFDRGMRLTPRLDVGWKHLYGDVRGTSHQRMASGSGIYTVEGIELDRDSLLLEAGLDLAVSPRHTLGLNYRSETGQDNHNGALMGQWRMMF
ncbi:MULTISPECIES: autotransporter outer membrane beta-barrel domain-containing protein [unclassified Pseudomonas]|uniref:autotransporter outer membrane beta-barrel domain-containing protein n=1 Tax=unclassified Pseudomonas TaxID=196821 RepID=UPI0030DC4736